MLLRETPSCRARSLTFSPASIRRNASSLNSRLNRLGSWVLKWSSSERRTVTIFLSQARGALQNVPDTWVTLSAFVLREVSMPWKASSVMEERLCFVARLLDGEAMTDVCRDFRSE